MLKLFFLFVERLKIHRNENLPGFTPWTSAFHGEWLAPRSRGGVYQILVNRGGTGVECITAREVMRSGNYLCVRDRPGEDPKTEVHLATVVGWRII